MYICRYIDLTIPIDCCKDISKPLRVLIFCKFLRFRPTNNETKTTFILDYTIPFYYGSFMQEKVGDRGR